MSKKNNNMRVEHMKAAQAQNPETVYNTIMAEKLSSTIFEMNDAQREHVAFIQSMKSFFSILELSGDIDNYKKLVRIDSMEPMTILDASFFLNAANRLSPNDLGMSLEEYEDFIGRNDSVVLSWNAVVTPMKTVAMRETEVKLTKNIIVPEKKAIIKTLN